jgi:hypothetical protein
VREQIVQSAEVVRQKSCEGGKVRALRALSRGRVRLLLELNFERLACFLGPDDDRQLYRCSEFFSETELLSAFDRAVTALGAVSP